MENYTFDICLNDAIWICNKETGIVYPIYLYSYNGKKTSIYNIETCIRCDLDMFKNCYGENAKLYTMEQMIENIGIVPNAVKKYYELSNGRVCKKLSNNKYNEQIIGFKKMLFSMKKEFKKALKKQNNQLEK